MLSNNFNQVNNNNGLVQPTAGQTFIAQPQPIAQPLANGGLVYSSSPSLAGNNLNGQYVPSNVVSSVTTYPTSSSFISPAGIQYNNGVPYGGLNNGSPLVNNGLPLNNGYNSFNGMPVNNGLNNGLPLNNGLNNGLPINNNGLGPNNTLPAGMGAPPINKNKEFKIEQKNLKKATKLYEKAQLQYAKGNTKKGDKLNAKANDAKSAAQAAADNRKKDNERVLAINQELGRLNNPAGPMYVDPEAEKKKAEGKKAGGRGGKKGGEADKKQGEAEKKEGEAKKAAGNVQEGEAQKKAGEAQKKEGEAEKKSAEGHPTEAKHEANQAEKNAQQANSVANNSSNVNASQYANQADQSANNAAGSAMQANNGYYGAANLNKNQYDVNNTNANGMYVNPASMPYN